VRLADICRGERRSLANVALPGIATRAHTARLSFEAHPGNPGRGGGHRRASRVKWDGGGSMDDPSPRSARLRAPRPSATALRRAGLGLVAVLLCGPGLAGAADASGADPPRAALSGELDGLSDAELERRIAFLEERLEDGRRPTRIWQFGFTSTWSLGMVAGSLQAGLTDEHDTRVRGIVTATKAAIGTARLALRPHPGWRGAAPLRAVEGEGRDALEARLRAGEKQLVAVARRVRRSRSWVPHLANFGINAAGSAVTLALGNPSDAAVSFGVGTAMGTILILSSPTRGAGDLKAYRRDVLDESAGRPDPGWSLAPMGRGLLLSVRF